MFSAIKRMKLLSTIDARFVVLKLPRSLTEHVEHKVSIAPIWARFIQFITSPETSISSRKNGNGDEKNVCMYTMFMIFIFFVCFLLIFQFSFPDSERGSECYEKDFYTVHVSCFYAVLRQLLCCFMCSDVGYTHKFARLIW
jgi:hypothetical protein